MGLEYSQVILKTFEIRESVKHVHKLKYTQTQQYITR